MAKFDESANRVEFEAWISKDCGDLTTFGTGSNTHYRNSAVNNAWLGWKQARAPQQHATGAQEAAMAGVDQQKDEGQ